MLICEDCGDPIRYGEGSGRLHRVCRGKRSGKVNKAKAEKHGAAYFSKASKEAKYARGSR